MFTREDISSLPVPEAHEVDGIPPKLLMETVEQISIPLASVQLVIKTGSGSF